MIEDSKTYGYLVRYQYPNHQGSCCLETDNNGNVITYEEYHPFGTTSYQATNRDIKASAKRYRYVGKERDGESGLYYCGARYYVPWLCRFISCDPKAAQFPSQSPYNYSFNNPINLSDPSGMAPEGPDDPPKNSEPATNGTNANKLPGFTPAKADPNIDAKNVRAAGTDGGAGATKMQNLQKETDKLVAKTNAVDNLKKLDTTPMAAPTLGASRSTTEKSSPQPSKGLDPLENKLNASAAPTSNVSATPNQPEVSKTPMVAEYISGSAAFAWGGGYSLELGYVRDLQSGEGEFFFSHGPTIGVYLGAGLNVGTVNLTEGNTEFSIKGNFAGQSSTYSSGLGPFGVSYGGATTDSTYQSSDWKPGAGSTIQQTGSAGVGAKVGLMWSRTSTRILD